MTVFIPSVLIVESDSRHTEIAMELIKDVVRANVDATNSGTRAIELVSRTSYQLVIADCSVGDMDGLSLLERVKRISPSTSVILTSSFASIEESVRVVKAGADEYFKKPYNPEQFKLSVRRCLDRRALYTGDSTVTSMMHLLNACQLVSSCLEEDKILETVVGYLKRETQGKGIALFRLENDERSHIPTAFDVNPEVVEVMVERANFIQACREERVAMKVIPKTTSTPEVAVFQFKCATEASYFVVSIDPGWLTMQEEIDSRFRLLQAQIQMTGRTISNYRGVRHLLYLDEPTSLFNTRYLHRCLDQFFEKKKLGQKETFSILFLDVDKFKGINDTHGHVVGTKLLFEMGQLIKKHLRKTDIGFRYGGDEFVVLLPETGTEQAYRIAEQLRQDIEQNLFLTNESLKIRMTVSIGVANCPEHATSKRDIIEAADVAMYAVKRSSRNKVYLAEKKGS